MILKVIQPYDYIEQPMMPIVPEEVKILNMLHMFNTLLSQKSENCIKIEPSYDYGKKNYRLELNINSMEQYWGILERLDVLLHNVNDGRLRALIFEIQRLYKDEHIDENQKKHLASFKKLA